MPQTFVETTILADVLLKPGARASSAKAAIARFSESLLPAYAIKEFEAGPLKHYIWLHGKLVTTNSFAKTLSQIRKMAMTPRKYWTSTAVEALEASAHKERNRTLGELVEKYGTDATEDKVLCDRYRLSLRAIIKRACSDKRKVTSRVVDELSCYRRSTFSEERKLIELGDVGCASGNRCTIAEIFRKDLNAVETLKAVVDAQPEKPENTRRSQALREILRFPDKELSLNHCKNLGDAVFAFCCPRDAIILTTNDRDIRPLAEELGKSVETPDKDAK